MTTRAFGSNPYDMERTLQGLLDRVDSLERKIVTRPQREIGDELNEVKRQVTQLFTKPTTLDFNDVFRGSGPAHALGYVPDPGPTPGTGAGRFLNEDGTWTDVGEILLLSIAMGDCC